MTTDYVVGLCHLCFQSLGPESCVTPPMSSVGVKQTMDDTVIELMGSDRPGLLSEVSAVLTNLKCNIVNAEVWTHNIRAAAVMHVNDEETGSAITDPQRLSLTKELLCNVLGGGNKKRRAKTVVADEVTIQSKDRPKLLFERVCTLTDMQYVVFHANIDAEGPQAYQVFNITTLFCINTHGHNTDMRFLLLLAVSFMFCWLFKDNWLKYFMAAYVGILHQAYRRFPCKIRCRKTKSDSVS